VTFDLYFMRIYYATARRELKSTVIGQAHDPHLPSPPKDPLFPADQASINLTPFSSASAILAIQFLLTIVRVY